NVYNNSGDASGWGETLRNSVDDGHIAICQGCVRIGWRLRKIDQGEPLGVDGCAAGGTLSLYRGTHTSRGIRLLRGIEPLISLIHDADRRHNDPQARAPHAWRWKRNRALAESIYRVIPRQAGKIGWDSRPEGEEREQRAESG